MKQEEEQLKHESYGVVRFSRRTGDPGRLFGSALNSHGSYVTLEVARATLIRDEHRYDRTYSSMRGDLIEVDLSAAQFAELLTTMNVGCGTPCTISYMNGKKMERPPEILHETERVRTGFKEHMADLVRQTEKDLQEVKKIFEEKSLTKKDRADVLERFSKIVTELRSNAPFMLEMFQEATERVTSAAKAEVDAFITTNVVAAGLKQLLEAPTAEPQAPQLPEGEE